MNMITPNDEALDLGLGRKKLGLPKSPRPEHPTVPKQGEGPVQLSAKEVKAKVSGDTQSPYKKCEGGCIEKMWRDAVRDGRMLYLWLAGDCFPARPLSESRYSLLCQLEDGTKRAIMKMAIRAIDEIPVE